MGDLHEAMKEKVLGKPVRGTPRSRCWLCGRFVDMPWPTGYRHCGHCDVKWVEGVENVARVTDRMWETRCMAMSGYARKYGFRKPGMVTMVDELLELPPPPVDLFDKFIDHSKVYVPTPG